LWPFVEEGWTPVVETKGSGELTVV